jgi:hypothetical protein
VPQKLRNMSENIEMNNNVNKGKCPCCGYFTLEELRENSFETCPVCYWENDGVQLDDPNYGGGANTVSLNEARENYKMYGASEKRFLSFVRNPYLDEMR